MDKEAIRLKGTGDGVKIYLAEEVPFEEIIKALRIKLEEFRKFFGTGHCSIYILGRHLEKSEVLRLESTISSMLPESGIHYGDKEIYKYHRKTEEIKETEEEIAAREAEAKAILETNEARNELKEIKDVVTTNFKSNRARFYEGVVRSGRCVESDGHLVLMGSVEEGGIVTAPGNIVILGALRGGAEAGCMGNENAYVVALDFNAEYVKIANSVSESAHIGGLKKAILLKNTIFYDEYLVN